jgi:hypothetical protein
METFDFTYEHNGTKTQILDMNRRIIKIGDKLEVKYHVGYGITTIVCGELVDFNVCGDMVLNIPAENKTRTIGNIDKNVESHENYNRVMTLGSKYMASYLNEVINTYVKKLN